MIICTEKVKENIRAWLPSVDIPETILGPSMASFFGVGVHVLPDEAFEGLKTREGEDVNLLSVSLDAERIILHTWDLLKYGFTTLVQIELDMKKNMLEGERMRGRMRKRYG